MTKPKRTVFAITNRKTRTTPPLHIADVADDWRYFPANFIRTRCNRKMGSWNIWTKPLVGDRECARCGTPDDFANVRVEMRTRKAERERLLTEARVERDSINNTRAELRRKVTDDLHYAALASFRQPLHAHTGPLVTNLKGRWTIAGEKIAVTIRIESEPATVSMTQPPTVNPHSWGDAWKEVPETKE